MRPFVETLTVKRLTRREIDDIERLALEMFNGVYQGQYNRIGKAIRRAKLNDYQAYINEQWKEEPELVERAVRRWYDDTAESVGMETINDYGIDLEWSDVNDSMMDMSAARAGWFARTMTDTSIDETQKVIGKWLETEGETLGDLVGKLETVWTGPRPQAAAITETTNIVAQSSLVTYRAAGWWGYNVYTMNDDRVRPHHTEVAENGPYPMNDTEHQPPINDDINCRCGITPQMEPPE
jgi:SPP1 gp7 family putative phage head morphogenesis protein